MPDALPRARDAGAVPETPPRGTETVLVIEDDEMVRGLLRRTLEGLGYRVLLAPSGNAALAVHAEHGSPIDAVLSDVVLPDISGPETVRRILASSGHAPAILFMSGHTDHPLLRDSTLQGEINFIQKPLTRGEIARKLRDVIDAR